MYYYRNNNNNNYTWKILIVLSSTAKKYAKGHHSGHLSGSQSVPGGRQLVSQAANLVSESASWLLKTEHSPVAICIIAQP